jgi:hypothetical protein
MLKDAGLKGEVSRIYNGKTYYKRPVFEFNSRTVLPRLNQKLNFKEVLDIKQKEGKAWTMWKKLTSKESTWLGSSQ